MDTEPKGNSTKYIVGIIIIALVIAGVSLMGKSKSAPDKKDAAENKTAMSADTPAEESADTAGAGIGAVPKAAVEVGYTDANGFTPDYATLKVGGTVTFVNKSTSKMWVGGNEHSTHTNYDGTSLSEHCAAGATPSFDQCGDGASYSFTFTKAGSFDYHNHLRPRMGGTVTVK